MNHTETTVGYLAHNTFMEMTGQCTTTFLQQITDAIESLVSGEIILAISEHEALLKEVPSFCGFSGHELIHSETKETKHHFWIRKK